MLSCGFMSSDDGNKLSPYWEQVLRGYGTTTPIQGRHKPENELLLGVEVGDAIVDKLSSGGSIRPLLVEIEEVAGETEVPARPFYTGLNVGLGIEIPYATINDYANRLTEISGQPYGAEIVQAPYQLPIEERLALVPTDPEVVALDYMPNFPAARIALVTELVMPSVQGNAGIMHPPELQRSL